MIEDLVSSPRMSEYKEWRCDEDVEVAGPWGPDMVRRAL